MPAAMQNFSMVFTGLDPVKEGWWRCMQQNDEACSSLHIQSSSDLCSLPADSWAWTARLSCFLHVSRQLSLSQY
jgi:hypothetical protein